MQHPSITHRILALFYGSLILISLWFAGTYLALIFSHGQEISSNNLLFKYYLLSIGTWFTLWFWTHGGQTIGMLAWRIKLVDHLGQPLGIKQAVLRLCLAIPLASCGIGLLWILVDKNKQALYERLSKTKLISTGV